MNSISISMNSWTKREYCMVVLKREHLSQCCRIWKDDELSYILKKVFLKISQNSQENTCAVYCPFLFIENLTFLSSISFLVFHHIFPPKQKASKKQKRYNLMAESLLSNITISHFKFILTLTCEKTGGLRRRNGTITLLSGKPRTVENMLL